MSECMQLRDRDDDIKRLKKELSQATERAAKDTHLLRILTDAIERIRQTG
jgi:hypothetical protein